MRLAPLSLTVMLALAGLIAGVALVTIWRCAGHLMFSLDDPYISLSLGWQIGHGHYGLNAGEAAAPSSSILYPLLLACFAWTPLQPWMALIINGLAAIGTGFLFSAIASRYGLVSRDEQWPRAAILLVTLCVALNTVGVVFTGLEHSLHAFTTVAVVLGLALILEGQPTPVWLIVAIVLAPLWRFEGAALALASVSALMLVGRWRAALSALGGILLAAGAYAAVMLHLGLPLVPSSVLVKQHLTTVSGNHPGIYGHMAGVAEHALDGLRRYPPGWVCVLLMILAVLHPILRARGALGTRQPQRLTVRAEAVLVAVLVATLGSQVLFGDWSGGYRYEVYAMLGGAAAVLILWHGELARFIETARPWAIAATCASLLAVNFYYVWATVRSPEASLSIYEQQYQLHRFATQIYPHPIAVNDLGWTSYRNPSYVLDLFGLGSEEARRARLIEHQPGWVDRLVQEHHVGLAMIFASWFRDEIPSGWVQLAVMKSPRRTRAYEPVTFYATSREAVPDAEQALRRFATVLPPEDTLLLSDLTLEQIRPQP
jgi:hypothetical protein